MQQKALPTEKRAVNATKERGKPQHRGILGSGSVCYRWKPVLEGRYEISVNSEKLDIILAVFYTGDCFDSLMRIDTKIPPPPR